MVKNKVVSKEQVAEDVFYKNMQKDLLLMAMALTTLTYKGLDAEKGIIIFNYIIIWYI